MLFSRCKTRPVIPRQKSASLGDFIAAQSRDFPVHLTMSHAIRTFHGARGDPEQTSCKDSIPFRTRLGTGGPHEKFERHGEFRCITDGDAVPDNVIRFPHTFGQIATDFIPGGNGQTRRLVSLDFQILLKLVVRNGVPFRIIINAVRACRFWQRCLLQWWGRGCFCNEGFGREGHVDRWDRTIRLQRGPETQEKSILHVGIGQQQNHRSGLLFTEAFDECGEFIVSHGVGTQGHFSREFQGGTILAGPSRKAVASQGQDPFMIDARADGIRGCICFRISTAIGMCRNPAHRRAQSRCNGTFCSLGIIELE